jgi:hypothetical protein
MARRVRTDGNPGKNATIGDSPRGDWDPDVAVGPEGNVTVVWDSYDGETFNVLSRRRTADGKWEPIRAVAASESFEGRADVTIDDQGRRWVLWEEGARRWGDTFRGGPVGEWTDVTDRYGPLHRLRELRIARLTNDGQVRRLGEPIPMPAMENARQRENKREGVELLGTYYERGKLTTDRHGRLWVVYRHFYNEQAGVTEDLEHHKERGWRIYARCLEGEGWSELYGFDQHQRDGMQRLSVTPNGDGLAAAWTIGRTDRRNDPQPRGVVLGKLSREAGSAASPELKPAELIETPEPSKPDDEPEKATVAGTTYRLFRGDLHRHTDLSLCFPFYDGSLQDAYRYAIDVAEHDFLGVTDHTRDIARGDALSQLWWRSTKEVTRHRLRGSFFPYFSYERSHKHTDHNVISLRRDMLRNFPPPLPEFWEEISRGDTFTIPHAPVRGQIWQHHDNAKRPLMEVYQGFRDVSSLDGAQRGLSKGYRLGFIASSDHMSTRGSYACVWSPEAGREPIFRAMQARRTFGATDDGIRLVFRTRDRWMGEQLKASHPPRLRVAYDGTAPIESAHIYRGQEKVAYLPVEAGAKSLRTSWRDTAELEPGEHYYFVHVKQRDGAEAWASPIWVKVKE